MSGVLSRTRSTTKKKKTNSRRRTRARFSLNYGLNACFHCVCHKRTLISRLKTSQTHLTGLFTATRVSLLLLLLLLGRVSVIDEYFPRVNLFEDSGFNFQFKAANLRLIYYSDEKATANSRAKDAEKEVLDWHSSRAFQI